MKIRMGFVPNSSSSSFIVQVWLELFEKKGRLISTAREQKLVKYGFEKTRIINPDQFVGGEDQRVKYPETLSYNYGYAVSCNQDDVIRFLVNNRIPFKASVNYGDRTLIYEGGDQVCSLPNYGLIFYKDSNTTSMAEAIGKLVLQNEGIHAISIWHYMNKKEQKVYMDSLRGSIKNRNNRKKRK
jgi:hypothetical protein